MDTHLAVLYHSSKCKSSGFEITKENLCFIDIHHMTEGCVICMGNTAVDTTKKFDFACLSVMHFGDKENWVNTLIEAATRELSKTTPLHAKPHRIYHTVVKNRL